MRPYLFEMPLPWGGTFKPAAYGFMILIGFLLCLFLVQRRGRRHGINPQHFFDLGVFGLLGGIVGARIFYVIDHWSAFREAGLMEVFRLWNGGLAFFGGIIGGALVSLLVIRRNRMPVRETLAVAASLVPLAHAFGRMGCFFNGCCYGRITHSVVGLEFPKIVKEVAGQERLVGSPPFLHHLERGLVTMADSHSLPVHPTQLYAVGYLLLAFAVLSFWLPRRHRAGDTAWGYAILYGVARFTNEFFRADTPPLDGVGGLTVFQALAIGAVIFGGAMLVRSYRLPCEPLPEPWQPAEEGEPVGQAAN